jgi:hypothetical protein
VSVKDCTVLTPMVSLELCTNHMWGFMGSNKSNSFYNYYVESHVPACVVLLLLEGEGPEKATRGGGGE